MHALAKRTSLDLLNYYPPVGSPLALITKLDLLIYHKGLFSVIDMILRSGPNQIG